MCQSKAKIKLDNGQKLKRCKKHKTPLRSTSEGDVCPVGGESCVKRMKKGTRPRFGIKTMKNTT